MASENPDEILLVIHGVGDPIPGSTVDCFARAMVSDSKGSVERKEKIWLREWDIPDIDHQGRYARTFCSHLRYLEKEGKTATAAEIFWGDLSKVQRGILGIIFGIGQVVFGLRYVAFAGADQPGWAAQSLKKLGLHSARLLHGPVLAVNFVLAVLTLLLIGTEQLWHKSYLEEHWADTLVTITSVTLFFLAGVFRKSTRNRIIERFWFWVMIGAMFLGLLVILKYFTGHGHAHGGENSKQLACGLFWYSRIFFVTMQMQYVWLVTILFGMTLCWILALLHPRTNRQGLHVGYLIPVILVGLWNLILPMFWVSGGEALRNFVEPKRYEWLFHEAVPMLSIQVISSLVLSIVTVFVLIWYVVWRSSNRVDSFYRGRRSPRLILNPVLQFCVGACALFGVTVSLCMAWLQLDGTPYDQFVLGKTLVEANKYAVGALLPIMGLLMLSVRHIQPLLDIVLDVVNHFYMQPKQPLEKRMHYDDEFDFSLIHGGSEVEFPVRTLIVGRVRKVLEHFANTTKGRPILNVICHSQGTLIAAESLNHPELEGIRDQFREINLITMGSPIGHLYQYYFPHLYPPVDQPFWSQLRSRVDRWVNIFRIDDYVGTEIPFSESIEQSNGPRCTNHPVQVAGHRLYWLDQFVLKEIAETGVSPMISASFELRQVRGEAMDESGEDRPRLRAA